MGHPGLQRWTWTLCVVLTWMFLDHAAAGPQYMVVIPAVLESGATTKFCASLLQPNETLTMAVSLSIQGNKTLLFKKTSREEFHECVQFEVPLVQNEAVEMLQVNVRGDTYHSGNIRKVKIKFYEPMTFIQTDKPIYLPGQTVHFRVITLDTKMRPLNQTYDVIELTDAKNNRIGQWLQKNTSAGKILQLSHALNSESQEGLYHIIVNIRGKKQRHDFKVEKYVLPKFDVKLNAAEEVSLGQEEFSVEVCAKYTYGQPVLGRAEITVRQPLERHRSLVLDVTLATIKKEAHKTGCTTFTIKSNFSAIAEMLLKPELHLTATVEEEGTGISFSREKTIKLSYVIGRLSFIDTPKLYEPGSDVEGKVKAVDYNDTPIANMSVFLFEGEWASERLLHNLTTDAEGIASFSLNTTKLTGGVFLHARTQLVKRHRGRPLYYKDGSHKVSLARIASPDIKTISSLEVKNKSKPLRCDTEADVSIHYTVVGEVEGSFDVIYLVMSRGAIIMQGQKHVDIEDKTVNEGELSFKLRVTAELAPAVQVVTYAVLPSETVIAHSADFSTEKCFGHKVSLEFSPPSAVPGEDTIMKVTAQPHSLCGVSAVDQSVLIQEPGKTLNEDKIFDLLPVKKASHVPHSVQDERQCLHVRQRRYWRHRGREDDAYHVFQNVGLKMATNLIIQSPTCLRFRGVEYHIAHRLHHRFFESPMMYRMGYVGSAPPADPPIKTVRTFFPETWIWDLVEVGNSGRKDVSLAVPDTITTWETEAFCLSPQGFGLAPREKITVFQPFFLELSLPYSIIRGEHFELKATVFNYLTSCIMVTVAAEPSLDYTLTPLSGDLYTSCLCGGESKTLSWTMVPSVLGAVNVTVTAEAVPSHATCDNEIVSVPDRGRIDVVTRSLMVKAEGTEETQTHNWLLCPKGDSLTEETVIQLPDNVIDGSARASVSVLGDILGRALNNLEGLLKMPYGCGEQNMALLAPNIYILQYLRNTQQLSPAIMEKAANFLTSGYQRQLNYRHANGAYSTFGRKPDNTWLTAFVLRSFTKAQSFVYIDPAIIQSSQTWLRQQQNESGCFRRSGKLFNNRMKGGVSDEVTLSAYITAGFLEMNMSVNEPVVNKSLSCLRESLSDLNNTYTTALLSYVFTLAGDMETRARLLKHLDTVGVSEGGFLHWSQTAAETSASLSVEISSYVLLAKLAGSPTTEDLGYASRIVRWLTGQQNPYGGFSSTQDTVVALQALALYATVAFSPEGSSSVTVQAPGGSLKFDVNQDNKLLYQEERLQDVRGKYSLEVKGSTCASVQISLHYNIPTATDAASLSVEARVSANCTARSHRARLRLFISATAKKGSTNMAILDIKLLSGFAADPESLKSLKGAPFVDRVEQKDDRVLVYTQEIKKDISTSYMLELTQEVPVQNLKPAVVKLYDYYQTSDQAETEYSYPSAAATCQ